MTDIKMPQMGESIAEGTISLWLVDVGQRVEADQPLVTVSTDKADVDIPAPASGVLAEIMAEAGVTVKVGELIGRIDEKAVVHPPLTPPLKGGEKVAEAALPIIPPLAPRGRGEGGEGEPGKAGEIKVEGVAAAEAMKPPEPEVVPPPEIEREAVPHEGVTMAGFYSPAVMRLAVETGVDLKAVKGTGHEGRVTKADVMNAAEAEAPSPPTPSPGGRGGIGEEKPGLGSYAPPLYEVEKGDTEAPFSRLRRLIADHMVYSKRTSAHVTTVTEVDFEHIVGIRSQIKDKIKTEVGISLTYLPFVMLAAIRALHDYPLMNSVVQGDTIITKKQIHMGVAVDSERGLMVPIIKNAGSMGLVELAKAVQELSVRVRDRKVTPDELSGGTFTVTNPGRHGNLFGTPIISQPQVGILRMGELVKRAVVVEADGEDAIAVRPMMYLSLSYDHRVADGLTANEFLHRIKERLEKDEFAP